jgi:hypothetical protein
MVNMGRKTPGDGTDFGRLREQPAERQRTGQDEMGMSPVWVDFDRLAQALDTASHSPEINIGKTDEKVPLEEERIARTEPHRFLDMGAGLARLPKEELHQPDIGACHGEIAVEADGEVEFAQRPFRRTHREQDGSVGHVRVGAVGGQRQRLRRRCLGRADLPGAVGGCVHVDFRHMGIGEPQQRADVVLVEAERGLKKMTGLPRRLERQMSVPSGPSVKGVIDGVETVRMLARRPPALRRDPTLCGWYGPGES